jgi:regulation of enolase protein 1 (concanavalin A-like superfamily)
MTLRIPGLPALSWTHASGAASYDEAAGQLTLTAQAGVDWSNSALGGPSQSDATALAFPAPDGDFAISARAAVDGERTTFDAAALVLWNDDDHWAKLCFEFSPQGEAMVVSVVTERFSDDCNSAVVIGSDVHLRIARVGEAWAFHSSADGERWDFVRLFRLGSGSSPWKVGFMAQAPMGASCTARFDRLRLAGGRLVDLRNGS